MTWATLTLIDNISQVLNPAGKQSKVGNNMNNAELRTPEHEALAGPAGPASLDYQQGQLDDLLLAHPRGLFVWKTFLYYDCSAFVIDVCIQLIS